MTLEHEGVYVWNYLVAALDRVTYERSNLRIHPWLDDTANCVIILVCLETVDSKSRRIDTQLDPTEKKFRTRLWTFKTADVMTITLTC